MHDVSQRYTDWSKRNKFHSLHANNTNALVGWYCNAICARKLSSVSEIYKVQKINSRAVTATTCFIRNNISSHFYIRPVAVHNKTFWRSWQILRCIHICIQRWFYFLFVRLWGKTHKWEFKSISRHPNCIPKLILHDVNLSKKNFFSVFCLFGTLPNLWEFTWILSPLLFCHLRFAHKRKGV